MKEEKLKMPEDEQLTWVCGCSRPTPPTPPTPRCQVSTGSEISPSSVLIFINVDPVHQAS